VKLDTIKVWVSKAQIKIWLVLGCITAVGAAGSLWHQDIPWSWLAHLAGALSPPLFTAGILGLTVDIFLKRELARDVFVAAFRYILPDELKEEVQRIISYKFLCIDSTTIVSISAPSNDIVRVEIKHERTFKNITGHTEPFYGTFAVDEWGFSQKSEILECRLEIGETKIDDADDNPDYEGKKDAIGKKTKSVSVKSGNTIKSITKGFEIHRPNGELHMQFSYPSRRPKVRVETPSGFSHSCTFGIPDEKVIRSSISQDYTLDGTQFPGQHTRVRWWPDCGMRLSQSTSSIVGFCVIAALMGFSLP
jgi:hypothetical protein